MNIIELILLCCLQATRKCSDLVLKGEDYLAEYHQIHLIYKHLYKNSLTKSDLQSLQLLINYFLSTKNVDLIRFLLEIKEHINSVTGSNDQIKLDERLIDAWNTPAHCFNIAFFVNKVDCRTAENMSSEIFLNICLLPSITNDFGIMLQEILRRNRETYQKMKISYLQLMEGIFATVTHSPQFSMLALTKHLLSHPEDAGIVMEIVSRVNANPSKPLDGRDSFSPSAAQLIERLSVRIPLPKSPPQEFIRHIEEEILERMNRLEAMFMVDLSEFSRQFSQKYGERLFREGKEAEALHFVTENLEELGELSIGLTNLCIQLYSANNECINFCQMFQLFPIFIWLYGENHKPEEYWDKFLDFRHGKIRECQGHIQEFINVALDNFKKDWPTLSILLDNVANDVNDFSEAFCSLAIHSAAIRDWCKAIGAVISDTRGKIQVETQSRERQQAELENVKQRSLEMQQQLIEEEKKHRKPPRRKPETSKAYLHSLTTPASPLEAESAPIEQEGVKSSMSTTFAASPITSSSSSSSFSEVAISSTSQAVRPADQLLNHLLDQLKKVEMDNPFAIQSWKNVIELYKDLIAEFRDLHSLTISNPEYVSDYLNRVLVISSQLMELILSAHLLEEHRPKDQYARWEMLRHDFTYLLAQSGLVETFSDLPQLTEDLANLEPLSRSIYTTPRRENLGAQLLYRIEEMRSTENSELIPPLLSDVHVLLKNQLSFIMRLIKADQELSINSLDELLQPIPHSGQEIPDHPLLEKIDATLSTLPKPVVEIKIGQPEKASLDHHLADAKRLLGLLRSRLARNSTTGSNTRNLYKILITLPLLATESLAIGGATLRGELDWTRMSHSQLSHNLMEWCEQLGFTEYTAEMQDYLFSSGKVHTFIRSPASYVSDASKHPTSQRTLNQISTVNRLVTTEIHHEGKGWKLAGRSGGKLQQVVSKAERNVAVGLTIFDKLIEKIFPVTIV